MENVQTSEDNTTGIYFTGLELVKRESACVFLIVYLIFIFFAGNL